MKNGIFKVDFKNVADAVLTAVVFAVLSGAVAVVTSNGFDVFTAHWVEIGKSMVNLGVVAGVVSLGRDLLTTNSGSVLNITPTA